MKTRFITVAIFAIALVALYAYQVSAQEESGLGKPPIILTLSEESLSVMHQFQQGLKECEWEKALSYCSESVITKAKEYESIEAFFRNVVPVKQLVQTKSFHLWRWQGLREEEQTSFGCSMRLREPDIKPTIRWKWTVNKTEAGWLIDFEPIPLELWIEQETLRKKRQSEEYVGQRKALEQKLKDVEIRLSPVSDTFILGQPLLFRLELINDGELELGYINVNNSMIITDEHGDRIPRTEDENLIFGASHSIKPGERDVLFDNFDIATQYAITTPGKYKVQFSGKGIQIWERIEEHGDAGHYGKVTMTDMRIPSNVVEIEITPNTLE